MNNDECGMRNDEYKGRNGGRRASVIHHSSFIVHHSRRRGLSLLEVLVSIGILTLGLLGVAMLIPIGKFAMTEVEKADRTGTCGRAALREIKIRRMINPKNWYPVPVDSPATPNIFVLDPLGYATIFERTGGGTATFGGGTGGVTRLSLQPSTGAGGSLTLAQAKAIFSWHDDLTYASASSSTKPTNGDRPMPVFDSTGTQQSNGEFSWFLTVVPSFADVRASPQVPWSQRRQFTVSVVVCWKRTFLPADPNAEMLVQPVNCDVPNGTTGYGGLGVSYQNSNPNAVPKENQWVMLIGSNGPAWYRVVAVGSDTTTTPPTIRVSLVGPDWYNTSSTPCLIIVPGVTGVYTKCMVLDDDLTWSR